MSGKFQPGDIVRLIGGLSAFDDMVGKTSDGNTVGSLIYGNRTGIIVSVSLNGYDVDFGKMRESRISISEQYLSRA